MAEYEIDDVQDCARCGGEHEGLQYKLYNPPVPPVHPLDRLTLTHWAIGPTTNAPILRWRTALADEEYEGFWARLWRAAYEIVYIIPPTSLATRLATLSAVVAEAEEGDDDK